RTATLPAPSKPAQSPIWIGKTGTRDKIVMLGKDGIPGKSSQIILKPGRGRGKGLLRLNGSPCPRPCCRNLCVDNALQRVYTEGGMRTAGLERAAPRNSAIDRMTLTACHSVRGSHGTRSVHYDRPA